MSNLRHVWMALALGVVLALGGCAHPISMTGEVSKVLGTGAGTKVDRKVGLVITEEQRRREVTTAGGGGDKVSYYPYRDLETGLYVVLSEHFAGVTLVNGLADPKIKAEGLQLTVVPEIATTSHSPSLLTWPPTIFTVTLECTIRDSADRVVRQVRVQGEGRAEFDEFKSDPSLTSKRAATDALIKLSRALDDARGALR